MIAVDTNILVYAHRRDSTFHPAAREALTQLTESGAAWAIPWTCAHEFFGVVTHPRLYKPASTLEEALDQLDAWMASRTLVLIAESDHHWHVLRESIRAGSVIGPAVHDAKIAALCEQHGVRELWTADRDFSRFPKLKVRNPLLNPR
ncbi:MAG: type II toxin-antitoxin system VapC family toxin [Panacagrimonas sp.]